MSIKLQLMPYKKYATPQKDDPLRFYYFPIIGDMYRKRVELCLNECRKGCRILEIGFGSGITFINLNDLYDEIYGLDLNAPAEDVMKTFRGAGIHVKLKNGSVLNMPYPDDYFDTVLLISILEHLKPNELIPAFQEIRRVLISGGQVIFGVPVESKFMVFMFYLLGYNIHEHHFSTEKDISRAAAYLFEKNKIISMKSFIPMCGPVYEVGHFIKRQD